MVTGKMCAPPSPTVDAGVALVLRAYPYKDQKSTGTPEILISQRKSSSVYGGYWEFPGGKVEPGESAAQCAQRESEEELGILVEVVGELDVIEHEYAHALVRLHGIICKISPESGDPRALEVAAWRWCGLDELPWEAFLPANVRLITALNRWLRAGHSPE